MANCKNCIKGYRYDIYKALKNYSLSNYLKIQKCNLYVYQEIICQYIIKKYYATYLVKKGKCIDCENLSHPKCTSNYKYYSKWIDLFTNKNYLDFSIKYLLSI